MTYTFNDLQFTETQIGTLHAKKEFDNGYVISVVAGEIAYSLPCDNNHAGNPDYYAAFEVAVMDSDMDFVTLEFFPDHDDDVVGWQSREDINNLIKAIIS